MGYQLEYTLEARYCVEYSFPFSEGVDFCKAKRRGSLTEQIFTHY